MSKRVSNKKGRPNKRAARQGRWQGHNKVSKYAKRRPLIFDPIQAIDQLIGKA